VYNKLKLLQEKGKLIHPMQKEHYWEYSLLQIQVKKEEKEKKKSICTNFLFNCYWTNVREEIYDE